MVIMMELQLQPLAAEGNGLLARNPDRGLRLELYMGEEIACDVFTVSRMANPAAHIERVIEKGIARCAPEQITLAQVYFYLTGYRGGEIDEAGFQAMQIYFDTLRAHGLKALLRFAYSTDPGVNDATQADMLRHIEQLRPFLERNKAYIHVLQAGMIGAWGEWHSEKKRVSRKKILCALAQAAPEGIYLQVRLPGLLKLLGKRHPAYCRTGLHDDSFFGNIEIAGEPTGWRALLEQLEPCKWRLLRRPARGGAAGGASLHFFERSARQSRLPRGRNQNDDGPLEAAGDHAGAFG